MKCRDREVEAIVPGVCGGCLHYIDNHDGDGGCITCDEIMAEVFRRWSRGEGNPPAGVPLVAMGVFPPLVSSQAMHMLQAAAEAEKAAVHGLTLGLTEGEVGEVVDAFIAYHRVRPSAFSWDEVWTALTLRAAGVEWKP